MKNIYLVAEYFNNGEYYEDECDGTNNLRAFATKEEAEQFIKELDNPTAELPEDEKYFEVFEGDEMFRHCSVYGHQFRRYFLHEVREGRNGYKVYETLAYLIREIPFGKENKHENMV